MSDFMGFHSVSAACLGAPMHIFFPEKGVNATTAKKICAGCRVLTECGEWADANSPTEGIYAGLSPRERAIRNRGLKIVQNTGD